MAEQNDAVTLTPELILKFHSGLEVLKAQQSEINRRIGRIEKAVDEDFIKVSALEPLLSRLGELEDENDQRGSWKDYIIQAILWAVGITIAASVATYFGLEVQF